MSRKYEKYTLEEFITDDYFIQWAKYPTSESDNFWHTFIKNESEQAVIVQKAKMVVQQLSIAAKEKAPVNEIPYIWTEIEDNIPIRQVSVLSISWRQWVAAASILLVLGIGYWWNTKNGSASKSVYSQLTSNTSKPVKEVINTSSAMLAVMMPDSSKVMLEPNSRLSYGESFKEPFREVYLLGEAFFDVKKNPKKPFIVYANGLVTKVLGTSFSVKAFETDKQVIVKVKSGKVSVYAHKSTRNQDPEMNGVVLTPNQKVVFTKDDERLTRTLIEKPLLLLTHQELHKFAFKDTSIEQIFEALEKAYGVDIIYDKEIMANCRLTTSLTQETLFEKLDIICEGIEASYKVVDAQIVITSNGCN